MSPAFIDTWAATRMTVAYEGWHFGRVESDYQNKVLREPVLATPTRYYLTNKSTERTCLDTNTADSGSVIQGSIPCSPTPRRFASLC